MCFKIGNQNHFGREIGGATLARRSFERGADLGNADCLSRLARMFDMGTGVETDKSAAMRFYQRAWRQSSTVAGITSPSFTGNVKTRGPCSNAGSELPKRATERPANLFLTFASHQRRFYSFPAYACYSGSKRPVGSR